MRACASKTWSRLGLANDANATTLRARLGFETGKAWNTSLLVEGEAVVPLEDDYRPDPSVPDDGRPIRWSPDPESYEVNRFQLVNTSLPGTTLTLGPPAHRCSTTSASSGNVGWRQNEQTFDAFRIVNKSVKNLVLDATLPQPGEPRVRRRFAAGHLRGRQRRC